jgi:hypothetical protein
LNVAFKQVSWGLFPAWVAASTVGFALGAAVVAHSGTLLSGTVPAAIAFTVSIGLYPLIATLPGFLHWLVLRHWVSHAGWWVLASGAGTLLAYLPMGWGLAVADTQGETAFARIAVPASMAAAGATVGVLQWFVLRSWVSRAGWWVLGSSVSWIVAEYAYLIVTRGSDVHRLLGGAVSGALSGAVTGLVLMWLLKTGIRVHERIPS